MRFPRMIVPLVIALTAWSAEALAQKSAEDEAKKQFEAGVELFEDGQFEKASVAFARAYELRPSFKITYLVARCEDELGHYAASLEAYQRYLEEGGDQIDAKRQEEVRAEIERLTARVGEVAIETDAVGATVFVDDERQGETPLDVLVYVDLGKHTVVVKQGSDELHREVIRVAGGQRVVVKVAGGGDGTETEAVLAGGGEAAPSKPKRLWTWVALGVGGAAAIGAGVTGGLSLSKTKDIKDDCDGNTCPGSMEDEGDKARALGYAADALVAVAGVGIAAGIALFFLEPRWSKEESGVEVAPVAAPTANGGALVLVGRF